MCRLSIYIYIKNQIIKKRHTWWGTLVTCLFIYWYTTWSHWWRYYYKSTTTTFRLIFIHYSTMGEFGLASSSASFFHFIPSKHTNLKVTYTTTPFDSHQTRIERSVSWSVVSAFRLRRLLICFTFTTACLPPHRCLISSPLPTTSVEMGQISFFFFFF